MGLFGSEKAEREGEESRESWCLFSFSSPPLSSSSRGRRRRKQHLRYLLLAVAPAAPAEKLDIGNLRVPDLPGLEVECDVDLDLQAVAPEIFSSFSFSFSMSEFSPLCLSSPSVVALSPSFFNPSRTSCHT